MEYIYCNLFDLFHIHIIYIITFIFIYILYIQQKTEERSVPIAIRIHRTLELADDKYYVITCGKAGFKNSK